MPSPIVFATRSMREYADRVVRHMSSMLALPAETLAGTMSTDRFADGEMEVSVGSSVRGRDVCLFTNSSRNAAGLSSEECKIELYHAVDAFRRAKASTVTVFEPFIGPSRSDRATRRNSVGLWVHLKILMSLGADQILTFQLHSDKSKSMVDPVLCRFDDIPAAFLLKKYLCDEFIREAATLAGAVRKDWLFCCVDSGGEKLAKMFSSSFGTDLVIAHKQRDYSRANTVESVTLLSATPLEGKTMWIVDDMIDTAGSVCTMVRELAKRKVASINIATVHALFSEPAAARLKALHDEGILDSLVACDTVPCPCSLREELPFLKVVSSAELAASVLSDLSGDRSLGRWFAPFDAGEYLSTFKFFY